MAGIQYIFQLQDYAALDALDRVADGATDLEPLMKNIGQSILASTMDRIAITNEAPDGVPWPIRLRAREHGGKTLRDTGHLLAALNSRLPEMKRSSVPIYPMPASIRPAERSGHRWRIVLHSDSRMGASSPWERSRYPLDPISGSRQPTKSRSAN